MKERAYEETRVDREVHATAGREAGATVSYNSGCRSRMTTDAIRDCASSKHWRLWSRSATIDC